MMSASSDPSLKKLRVAVIGCGPIGNLHASAIADSHCAELTAVCDPDLARATVLAARYHATAYADFNQLLSHEKPNVVTIATPDHLHVAPALEAIAAGCHVFCEKPMAETSANAERVVRAANERNVFLGVDYNRRFAFGYRTAKRLFDEGAIGKLQHCLVRVSDPIPPAAVARHPHVIFTTLLTHHLDLMRFFGGEIRRIQATAAQRTPGELVSCASLMLQFVAGPIGAIVAGYRAGQTRTSEWMGLGGSAGSLAVEDVTRRVILTGPDADRREVFEPSHFASGAAFYDSLIEHLQCFLNCVNARRSPYVSGQDGLIGLKLAEAAIESLERGCSIEVPGT